MLPTWMTSRHTHLTTPVEVLTSWEDFPAGKLLGKVLPEYSIEYKRLVVAVAAKVPDPFSGISYSVLGITYVVSCIFTSVS